MRFRFQILVALLAGCATPPPKPPPPDAGCVTPCGLSTSDGNCDVLREFEPEAVKALGALPEMTPELVCESIRGWKIKVHPRVGFDTDMCGDLSWWLAPGLCIAGYTWRDDRTIELATSNWPRGALAHEIVHVADLARHAKPGHCLWKHAEVGTTLEQLTGRHETQKPEPDCSP